MKGRIIGERSFVVILLAAVVVVAGILIIMQQEPKLVEQAPTTSTSKQKSADADLEEIDGLIEELDEMDLSGSDLN